MITKDWRDNLHAYLGGITRRINGVPLGVGGIEDLLIGLRATHRLDYVPRELKLDSSSWVHQVVGKKQFDWQPGYLGVTVSPSEFEKVKKYVLNQGERHRRRSFQEEYLELLKLSGIEFDELCLVTFSARLQCARHIDWRIQGRRFACPWLPSAAPTALRKRKPELVLLNPPQQDTLSVVSDPHFEAV